MRLLFIIIIFNSCAFNINQHKVENQTIQVYQLDSNLLLDYTLIKFKSGTKKGIILSKKDNVECLNKVTVGETYRLPLTKIFTTQGINGINFRLYANDIYFDGVLVFPKTEQVYISSVLKGLCIGNQ